MKYATTWDSKNATNFANGGHYAWMADFVDDYERVLEIGTGTGNATLTLAQKGHSVISVDENDKCLEIAKQRLANAGVEVEFQQRGKVVSEYPGYVVEYCQPTIAVPRPGGVALIEGDALADDSLNEWLVANGPFDAVVCWLIGTHDVRFANLNIASKQLPGPSGYRLCVQNRVYELADRVLRSGGILHIVDRAERRTAETREWLNDDALKSHQEQASVTNMAVDPTSIRCRDYSDPPDGVKMIVSPGTSGRMLGHIEITLFSIIARKPS